MPVNAGELQARLTLDRGAFQRGLGQAKAEGSRAGGGIGDAVSSGLMGAITAGAVAAGVAATVGIKKGFDYNAAIQNGRVAFTVLLKDARKAKQTVADLYAFSAKTPFEFPEVLAAGQKLATVGLDVKKNLSWIGDIGALNKDAGGIETVAAAIARLQSGDFGESFERLRDFAISRKDLEGEGLVFDRSGSYQGSAEQAVEAVRKIAAKKFGGMSEAQSKTFSGQWSTAVDNVNAKLGELTMPAFTAATDKGLPAFNKALGGLNFKKLGKEFAPELKRLGEAFKNLGTALGPVAKDFMRSFGPMLKDQLRTFIGVLTDLLNTGAKIAPLMYAAGKPIIYFGMVVQNTQRAVIRVALKAMQGDFAGAFGVIKSILAQPMQALGVFRMLQRVKDGIRDMVNTAIGWLNRLIDGLNKIPGVNIGKVSLLSSGKNYSGGAGGTGNAGQIPRRHSGGDVPSTGVYRLLAGERVLKPSDAAASRQPSGDTYHITVNADSLTDERRVRNVIRDELANVTRRGRTLAAMGV